MIVLGLDTGFAALGWAQLRVTTFGGGGRIEPLVEVLNAGVITTTKEAKKRQLHVGSDDARRLDELAAELGELMAPTEGPDPDLIAYELPAAAKGARAAHALGLAHGLIRGVRAYVQAVPIVEVTARDVKAALVGKTSAGKPEMIAAALRRCAGIGRLPKTVQEHAADAVGVALAALETQVAAAVLTRPAAA